MRPGLSLARSYGTLLILLAMSGFGTGCIYPSAVKSAMQLFPVRERATAIGFNQTAVNASGIVGATILPGIAVAYGWQYGFLAVGLLGLAIFCICAAAFRNPPRSAASLGSNSGVEEGTRTSRRPASASVEGYQAPRGGWLLAGLLELGPNVRVIPVLPVCWSSAAPRVAVSPPSG